MDYETIARILFISDHPFTRWRETDTPTRERYVLKAERLLMGPGQHDYKVNAVYVAIKEAKRKSLSA